MKDNINNLFQRVPLKNTKLTQAQMESVLKLITYEFNQSLIKILHQISDIIVFKIQNNSFTFFIYKFYLSISFLKMVWILKVIKINKYLIATLIFQKILFDYYL